MEVREQRRRCIDVGEAALDHGLTAVKSRNQNCPARDGTNRNGALAPYEWLGVVSGVHGDVQSGSGGSGNSGTANRDLQKLMGTRETTMEPGKPAERY